jgi:hypothetical protein
LGTRKRWLRTPIDKSGVDFDLSVHLAGSNHRHRLRLIAESRQIDLRLILGSLHGALP